MTNIVNKKIMKNINEEINRIKQLFTEERLYGNLVNDKIINEQVSKVKSAIDDLITIIIDRSKKERNISQHNTTGLDTLLKKTDAEKLFTKIGEKIKKFTNEDDYIEYIGDIGDIGSGGIGSSSSRGDNCDGGGDNYSDDEDFVRDDKWI